MVNLDYRIEEFKLDLRQLVENRGRPGNIPIERLSLFEQNGWIMRYTIRDKPFYIVQGDVFHRVS